MDDDHENLSDTLEYSSKISFGTLDASLDAEQDAQITLNMMCDSMSPAHPIKYCVLIYPGSGSKPLETAGTRSLWQKHSAGAPALFFNLLNDGAVWGAGTQNGDYGTPIIGSTGADSGTKNYALNFTVKIPPQSPEAAGLWKASGYYARANINYTNPNVTDEQLCNMDCPGGGTSTFDGKAITFSATLKEGCQVRTDRDIDFGKAPDIAAVRPAEGDFSVKCGIGQKYSVTVGSGDYPEEDGTRQMRCAACGDTGAYAAYLLWQDSAMTVPWGAQQGMQGGGYAGTGTGGWDSHAVYASIAPGQSRAPAGAYSDTVIITLTAN